jgi:hypothetical protein
MRTRALLPFAVTAAGLVAASPAAAATHGVPAHLSGGDAPPVVPSLIQTRITRTENALDRLTKYVDNNQPVKVVAVGKVIRRQTAAAWRGAKYYLRTAPPPVAGDAMARPRKLRTLKGGAVGPVVADQYASAVAVFGLAHDVTAQAVELTDGAHGNTLAGLSKTLFWTLDKRDVMVTDAQSFEPPAPPADGLARARGRSLKAITSGNGAGREYKGGLVAAGFAALMPQVTQGLDDEMQHIDGLRSDATDLDARGKSTLRQGETQILFTERTINTIWPPVPADD